MKFDDEIDAALAAVAELKTATPFLEAVGEAIVAVYQAQKKVLIAGNGGSLADAIHFAEELTGYYRHRRPALPALALADPGHITCVANDESFDHVFSRSIEALGQEGDLFIALSTSGNSKNLIEALKTCQKKQIKTVAFLGKEGGKMRGVCDLEWIVTSSSTSDHIQEAHMTALHLLVNYVESKLFTPLSTAAPASSSLVTV